MTKREKSCVSNLLDRTHKIHGDNVSYRFGNGLIIKTETFASHDPLRILGIGIPQGTLLNQMVNSPDFIKNKEVFEPFAGSGVLGFMALKAGAKYVEFLDINPRAVEFQRQNAELNHFRKDQIRLNKGDIRTFNPERKFDLLYANPPFVPTPDGIDGIITSNGGEDGNTLVRVLFTRIEDFVKPAGESFIYVFQIVRDGVPLVADLASELIDRRPVEVTLAQEQPIDFELYVESYMEVFPDFEGEISRWKSDLVNRLGNDLSLSHFVVHVGLQSNRTTSVDVNANFIEKYGKDFLLRFGAKDLSIARVNENRLPGNDG